MLGALTVGAVGPQGPGEVRLPGRGARIPQGVRIAQYWQRTPLPDGSTRPTADQAALLRSQPPSPDNSHLPPPTRPSPQASPAPGYLLLSLSPPLPAPSLAFICQVPTSPSLCGADNLHALTPGSGDYCPTGRRCPLCIFPIGDDMHRPLPGLPGGPVREPRPALRPAPASSLGEASF